jgi:WD40 repeat protein
VEGGRDHSARLRDAVTGDPLGPILRHGSSVLYAAFSADGGRLITGSDDNTARVWAPRTGELLAQPLKHRGNVRYAVFSPDGRYVLTAAEDRTARVWDSATGEPLTPPLPVAGVARSASFSAGGERVSVHAPDGTVSTWDLRGDDRPTADLLHLAHVLAGTRVDPERGLLPLEPDVLQSIWKRLRSEYPGEFPPGARRPTTKP